MAKKNYIEGLADEIFSEASALAKSEGGSVKSFINTLTDDYISAELENPDVLGNFLKREVSAIIKAKLQNKPTNESIYVAAQRVLEI